MNANEIATKWVAKLGLGFHPDTRGSEYAAATGAPSLTASEVAEYEADMDTMFASGEDIYEVALEASMAACGFLVGGE